MNAKLLWALMSVIVVLSANCMGPDNAAILKNQNMPQTAMTPDLAGIPYELISQESLFGYLEDITSIQPYSGWRNSASSGEAEALDYVNQTLSGFSNLDAAGLEVERQEFPVFMETEIWESGLTLTVNGQDIKVRAEGIRGARGHRRLAAYVDSDGVLNDSHRDPFAADGTPLMLRDREMYFSLKPADVDGKIIFLDYSLVDTAINSGAEYDSSNLMKLIDKGPAGLVMVIQYSNRAGETRGSFAGEGGPFLFEVPSLRVPVLYVRMEDLAPAGISSWADMERIQSAQLLLDADVMSPGRAGNLIARIPGADPSKAVILGAHVDSPNGPGAFDDGSGAATLLEIARVLDASQFQPAVDLYLAWFGGHEIGGYGSSYFISTHQDLLDRTLGMAQMDGLGHPLDGRNSKITMMAASYGRFGDDRLPMADFLTEAAASQGLEIDQLVEYKQIADNSNFDAFNVPNVYLGYMNARDWKNRSNLYNHYSNHFHDPYESVDLAREVGDAFVGMTKVMLAAGLEIGRAQPDLRVTPAVVRKAVIVGSHAEAAGTAPSMMRELGMALAWEGFDVDLIPYGQAATSTDLEDAGIVVLPPTGDFPGDHLETWSQEELGVLEKYVADGGFLVVTNASCVHVLKRCLDGINEDMRALNPLLVPMGITFTIVPPLNGDLALSVVQHPLTSNARYLFMYPSQGVPFRMAKGMELMRAQDQPVVALVDYGDHGGQVLVIADLGLLQADTAVEKNMEFLKNIAGYARTRESD